MENKHVEEKIEIPEELKEISKDPYNYICEYVESIYPNIGRKTFRVLSLLPVSLIIPDIPSNTKKIRSNLHAIFLGASGSGKTSIAKLFSKFVINSLEFESITSAGLESAIAHSGGIFTLIVGDFARMSRDPILMKVLEGVLGEERRIQRTTARKDLDMDVNAISLLCGVSTDLSKYILSGMIWRCVPILIGHTAEEHSDIGKHIRDSVGNIQKDGKEEIIKRYYGVLSEFQTTDKKVTGYDIPYKFRDDLFQNWKILTEPYVKELGLNFFRELWDGYRFMVSHSFLNIFNREIDNGILKITDEDYRVSLNLMKQSIKFKFRLIRSESFVKRLKDAKDFKKIMESDKIPEQVKDMIRSLAEVKGNRVKLRG